jgi:hypothetical protein
MMKKWLVRAAAASVLAAVLGLGYAVYNAQRADYGWNPVVRRAAYTTAGPVVVIDEAHNNASTAGIGGRYWPLGRLLRKDGYDVRRGGEAFAAESLTGNAVLIIANASGAPKPQFMGINIPVGGGGDRGNAAFTAAEIRVVEAWVRGGGSLLLIADHAPFGAAAEGLASVFGVRMYKGFLEVPGEQSDPLLFTAENGRLGDHPIIAGDGPQSAVRRVMTFTGQSLDGPAEASVLLRLPPNAVEIGISETGESKQRAAGRAQGIALQWGKGRVVVLGEAAMLTAQVANGAPFGMNTPGCDNQQLALNILHWLSRKL